MGDGAPTIRPSGRVLKAAEAREWIGEIDALRAARRRTERRMEAARRAWRRARAAGRREGWEEGVREGVRDVASMLNALNAERERVETELPGIVASIVERILGDLERDEFLILCVREALAVHGERGRATLRVSPSCAEDVSERISDLAAVVAVEPDGGLDDGRSLLVFGDAILELGLETQMRALRADLAPAGGTVR